jgi:V/A-type H+-transporting ATPase subunit I
MKVPVKKILFVGSKDAHETFFQKAQNIGWFEFISVSGQKPHLFPKPIEELKFAIKILKKQPIKEAQVEIERAKTRQVIDRIIELKLQIDKGHEEKRLLDAEIVKVHPLGDFSLEEVNSLEKDTGKFFQFLFIRHERLKKEEIPSDLIYLKRELDFDYYLYITDQKLNHPAFTEVFIRKSLRDLYADRTNVINYVHQLEKELRELTCYWNDLEEFLLEELSRLSLTFAKEDVDYYLEDGLFAIEAWIPENKLGEVGKLIKDLPVYVTQVSTEERDIVPTYLENKGFAKIGQDLVEIYDVPSTRDKDPSFYVLCSFALFFGMIVSDAGYGLLFLIASLYARFKLPNLKGVKKRFLNLATLLSCTSIAWGILIASYFSIQFDPASKVNKTSILYHLALQKIDYHKNFSDETFKEWEKEYPQISEAKTPLEVLEKGVKVENGKKVYKFMNEMFDNLLLEISILVGIIHLSFAFIRNLGRSWAGIGWVITMWGSYLFFPKIVGAISLVQYLNFIGEYNTCVMGQQLLFGGLGISLILTLIQERLAGLAIVFKLIEVFADVLSYLRLYALGLAGMVMASTFNEMGAMVGGGIIGALVIFFGHTINITLTVMAGVLHGLRLNFLEWYHHCFEGGGRKFRPLRVFIKE